MCLNDNGVLLVLLGGRKGGGAGGGGQNYICQSNNVLWDKKSPANRKHIL